MKQNVWMLSLLFGTLNSSAQNVVSHLSCEYLSSPLGVDVPHPRLSWQMEDSREGASQRGFRLIVGTDSTAVAQGKSDAWDTGYRSSDAQRIVYKGKALRPLTAYYWRVSVRNDKDEELHSPVVRFETGLRKVSNWQGAWIGDGQSKDYRPAPYFRREFQAAKPVKEARAYIATAGLYELYINGRKVGNHRLDPTYTRFDRRLLYVTYDVTSYLQHGANAVGVLLGNGWYNHQSKAVWDFDRAGWRNRPAFCMDVRVTYADGTQEVIPTDTRWKTSGGALQFNSIYTSEQYDASLEQEGWNRPGFDDKEWRNASFRQAPASNIVSQQLQPIRNVEELRAVKVNQLDDTTYVFDFGRNIAGVTRLQLKGQAHDNVLRLKHGERIYSNGHVDLSNIDVYFRGQDDNDYFQTDVLKCPAGKAIDFMPRFNYKGFRYVEVTSTHPVVLTADNLQAYFMHSDVAETGEITSSDDLLNRIWKAGRAAYISNLYGYPTDCPQREKNGWTGDGHFAIETGLYNYDGITVYEKWMADHRDEQQPNGVLPDIIPTWGWGYGTDNGTDWTSTIALIPWNLYLFYGDDTQLRRCYDHIKRYVDYVDRISLNHLTTFGRGDWVPVKSHSSKELTSSVYFYVDATILARAAKMFGHKKDFQHYTALAAAIRKAINEKYLDRKTGIYASGTQTELSVPLYWGVVPDELRQTTADRLAESVRKTDNHLDVGVLGTKAILNALSENGYADVAYRLAVQDTYPSWGWWVKNGATTFLENWDLKATRDISDNHIMFSEVVAWLHKGLGGIYPDSRRPGFKHTVLRPYFPRDLRQFKASHVTPYGTLTSSWQRKGNTVTYTIVLPPNTTATLYYPRGVKGKESQAELKAGTHTFKLKMDR